MINCQKTVSVFSPTLPSHRSKILFGLKKLANNVPKTRFSVNKNVFYKKRVERVKEVKESVPSHYILKTLMKLVFHCFTSTTFKLPSHAVCASHLQSTQGYKSSPILTPSFSDKCSCCGRRGIQLPWIEQAVRHPQRSYHENNVLQNFV